MATTRSWTGRDGERREETLFIDVTVWDRQAENCCQYLRKGSAVHVEGSLKMDTWDDKNTGEKRSKIRVHADRVQFLDGRRGDSGGGTGAVPTMITRRARRRLETHRHGVADQPAPHAVMPARATPVVRPTVRADPRTQRRAQPKTPWEALPTTPKKTISRSEL